MMKVNFLVKMSMYLTQREQNLGKKWKKKTIKRRVFAFKWNYLPNNHHPIQRLVTPWSHSLYSSVISRHALCQIASSTITILFEVSIRFWHQDSRIVLFARRIWGLCGWSRINKCWLRTFKSLLNFSVHFKCTCSSICAHINHCLWTCLDANLMVNWLLARRFLIKCSNQRQKWW